MVKMMQGNRFICATQIEAMQPDKEMQFSGMFTEWTGIVYVSQLQQN